MPKRRNEFISLRKKPFQPKSDVIDQLLAKGDFEGARDALRIISANNSEAHLALGLLLWNHFSDFEGALTSFEESIRLNPKNGDAFMYRGCIFMDLNKNELAHNAFQSAIHLGSQNAKMYVFYGMLSMRMDQEIHQVIELFETAISLDNKVPQANFALGILELGLQQNFEKACEYSEKEMKIEPSAHVAKAYVEALQNLDEQGEMLQVVEQIESKFDIQIHLHTRFERYSILTDGYRCFFKAKHPDLFEDMERNMATQKRIIRKSSKLPQCILDNVSSCLFNTLI